MILVRDLDHIAKLSHTESVGYLLMAEGRLLTTGP